MIKSIFDLVTELNALHRQVHQPTNERYRLKVSDSYPRLAHIARPDGTIVNSELIFGHPAQEIEAELNRQLSIIRANA